MGMPGLVAAYNPKLVPQAGKDMYKLGWILTFTTAGVVYFFLIKIRKPKVFPIGFEDVPVTWEYLATGGRDGFFDGERDAYGQGSSSGSVVEETCGQVDEKPKSAF
jgi:NCS1 family nucleobase:cation symporter-1